MATYDSTKDDLQSILKDVSKGKVQLPEFQRDWVWDDEHVRSLLASVTLSYPIGAVMLLQTGGEGAKFKTRTVEGVDLQNDVVPEFLILDGQQRLTALYQALFSPLPVSTRDIRKKPVKRHYHVVIDTVLSGNDDREEAIISLPEDRILLNFRREVISDLSDIEKQCAAGILPLDIVMNSADLMQWMMCYFQEEGVDKSERMKKWERLNEDVLQPIQKYQLPIIQLKKETPKVAVCQVFEKVNTGGVSLTVFELLTATFAADGFDLRKDWERRHLELKKIPVLRQVQNDDFLQAISLLKTKARRDGSLNQGLPPNQAPGISCKRKEILKLDCDDYKSWADFAEQGFIRAGKFLYLQKMFSNRDVPYRTQIVPLSVILAVLDSQGETDGVRTMIEKWYWSGIFGELYGSAIEGRFAKDYPEVVDWVGGGDEPSTIADSNFAATRLLTMRTRNSAAYKGLYALLIKDGEKDLRTGESIEVQTYFDDKIDIHHIFPQSWCEKNGIPSAQYNSIINKTALAAKTNRKIGGRPPSEYLSSMEKEASITPEQMDEILVSHAIDPQNLRADDFLAFFESRAENLLQHIERATGKTIAREPLLKELPALQAEIDFEEEFSDENDE